LLAEKKAKDLGVAKGGRRQELDRRQICPSEKRKERPNPKSERSEED